MSKEFEALVALRDYLRAYLDPAPQPALADGQIVLAYDLYPDIDAMPHPVMLYIFLEQTRIEQSSLNMSQITEEITIYLLAKNKPISELFQAVHDYCAAVQNAINKDRTLNGSLAECEISEINYANELLGVSRAFGAEMRLALKYERTTIYYPDDNMMPDEGLVSIGG